MGAVPSAAEEQEVMEARQTEVPSLQGWPGFFDHIPGVIAEHRLEFSLDRLRVVGDSPVEGTEGCRLPPDALIDGREALIRGYGDQGERDSEVHCEGSKDSVYQRVPIGLVGGVPADPGADEDEPQPGEADKDNSKQEGAPPTRYVVDPVQD